MRGILHSGLETEGIFTAVLQPDHQPYLFKIWNNTFSDCDHSFASHRYEEWKQLPEEVTSKPHCLYMLVQTLRNAQLGESEVCPMCDDPLKE